MLNLLIRNSLKNLISYVIDGLSNEILLLKYMLNVVFALFFMTPKYITLF